MKLKLLSFVAIALGCVGLSNAAVTVSIKNFTSTTAGVAIVTDSGAAVSVGSVYASAGIFTSIPNWSTASASDILALFVALDSTPVVSGTSSATQTGVFSANDMAGGSYPANFSGSASYIVVGNASTLSASTKIAVYSTGSTFTAVDGAGNATVALNGTTLANWVYGKQVTITTASSIANNTFGAVGQTGIALTSVPEPSAALLGLLGVFGLVRRRR